MEEVRRAIGRLEDVPRCVMKVAMCQNIRYLAARVDETKKEEDEL